jgi:nicotinamide mononucleotide transporter
MSFTEIIAVLFSLICTWLAVKKHILNWPMGIIAVIAYMLLFYKEKLYADMVLQVIFMIQGFYGWYNWVHKKEESEITVSCLSFKKRILYVAIIIGLSLTWAYLLINFTNASSPLVDSFVATTSLVANWLMAKKKIENWILWIIADIIYVALFWYKELYLSSFIYLVFLCLAYKGYKDWNRKNYTEKVLS